MRVIRFVLAFLLTLMLFWVSPQLPGITGEKEFYDTSTPRFLIDHTAKKYHRSDSDPVVSVRVTTPEDTSQFLLTVIYRKEESTVGEIVPMRHVSGTLDLYSAQLPRLEKSGIYKYHIELKSPTDGMVASIPEDSSEIELMFVGRPGNLLVSVYTVLIFLAAMFGFLALFDALALDRNDMKLVKLSRKVFGAAAFTLIGSIGVGAFVYSSIYGNLQWPFGNGISFVLVQVLALYWLFLTFAFKGTLFRFEPEKNLIPRGGIPILTSLGVILMIVTYILERSP